MSFTIGTLNIEGNTYYRRQYLLDLLWKDIKSKNNIVISAPRRIGKSSILKDLESTSNENYHAIYLTTESINDTNKFFRKIYKELIQYFSQTSKFKKSISQLIRTKRIKKIGVDGIEIIHNDTDFYEEIISLLGELDLENTRLLLLLDEFSQTLENISKDKSEREAIEFLHKNRELRQSEKLKDVISFIYSGSIGLENIVERMDSTKAINDLKNFEVPPFEPSEAYTLMDQLLSDEGVEIHADVKYYFAEKLKWLIPFYIQIVLEKATRLIQKKKLTMVAKDHIDEAFEAALDNRLYFDHWYQRLRIGIAKEDYNFVLKVLGFCARNTEGITKAKAYDTAVAFKCEDKFSPLMNMLIHDGYVSFDRKSSTYKFNSPLLRLWWNENVNF